MCSELAILFACWERLRQWHATEVFVFLCIGLRRKGKEKGEVTTSFASCYQVEIYSGWAPDEGKVRVGSYERSSSRENLIRDGDSVERDLAVAMGLDT